MFSLFSSRTLWSVAIAIGITAMAVPALASGPGDDSVTTREAAVVIDGVSYQQVQFENRDYFIKAPRPGSSLSEVSCQTPKGNRMPSQLAVASRSREFVTRLRDGCAPKLAPGEAPASESKTATAPERFTFEQPRAGTHKPQSDAPKPKQKVELLGPNSFPPDVDPHVLPEQQPAGGNFDWNQRRY